MGEEGSGRQASATEDTQHFGRLNIKTVITVRSQLTEFETSGRFCLFVIDSLEKFVSEGRAEMIDLLKIEVEIAKINRRNFKIFYVMWNRAILAKP